MFGDTVTLPLSGGSIVLKKINQDSYTAEYLLKEATREHTLKIRHSKTNAGMERHNVEVVRTTYAAGEVPEYTQKAYVVLENIPSDTTVELADGLADFLIVAGNLAKLVGWES